MMWSRYEGWPWLDQNCCCADDKFDRDELGLDPEEDEDDEDDDEEEEEE